MKNKKPMSQAKANLIELSKVAKQSIETGMFEGSVNEFLVDHHAANKGCTVEEFKTVSQWREFGMKIIKGTKSSMVWARPRKSEKTVETEAPDGTVESIEEKFRFWPTCNLFAPCDVEEMSEAMKAHLAAR